MEERRNVLIDKLSELVVLKKDELKPFLSKELESISLEENRNSYTTNNDVLSRYGILEVTEFILNKENFRNLLTGLNLGSLAVDSIVFKCLSDTSDVTLTLKMALVIITALLLYFIKCINKQLNIANNLVELMDDKETILNTDDISYYENKYRKN